MSEEPKEPKATAAPKDSGPLTNEMLFKMLIDAQKEAANSNKLLAEALIEGRKPYVDPKVLEARRQELVERQRQVKMELLKRQLTKEQCHHHRIDDAGNMMPVWNIKWMRHSNNIILGVCGICFSQFDASRNPKDAAMLRQDPNALRNMGMARA